MQSDNQVSNVEQKPKIVTGFIHYDKEDDLTKIFNVLQDFRSRRGLKFSHHRGQIFFSIRSEHLDELHTMQQYKISKYSTRTTYECDQAFGNRLVSQRDSFLRMTYQDDAVLFSSRTPPRIHYQLVQRVFKDTNSFFDKQKYVLCKKYDEDDNNEDEEKNNEYIKVTRNNYQDRVNRKPYQPHFHNNSTETDDQQATPVPSKGRGKPYQHRTISESFSEQDKSSTTEKDRSSSTEKDRSSSTTEQDKSSTTEQDRSKTEQDRSTTERGRPSTRGRGKSN